MKQRLVFFFQPIYMGGWDELEGSVVTRGLRPAQPNLAEAAPAEKANEAIAVEDKGG
jgi:hypothetical protein